MNDFSTIFVITEETYIQEPYYWGLLALVGGILFLVFQLRRKMTSVKGYFASIFLMVWGIIWFVASLDWQVSYNRRLDTYVSLYNEINYEIVEGIVNVQYRGQKEGHDGGDVIVIDKKEFQLSHFTATPAYHESIVYGGVLRNGVYVRIYHNNGDILRIDKMEINTNPTEDTREAEDAGGNQPI